MKKIYALICCTFMLGYLQAQITTFPHVENFDGFPLSAQNSSTEPNPNSFPGGWENEVADDGPQDWYSVQGATLSTGTGPNADHTSGSGRYLYVEDSLNDNDSVTVKTPTFDVSALANPYLVVWIHSEANHLNASFMGDSSLNDLKLEILSGGVWSVLDSIGDLNADWTEFSYDLSAYTGGTIQFRFRANNNNYGDFIHDIAIDDFTILDLPPFEASLEGGSVSLIAPAGYTIVPASQGTAVFEVDGTFRNIGLNDLTSVKLKASSASYSDSVTVATLTAGSSMSVTLPTTYTPSADETMSFTLSVAETESDLSNNIFDAPVVAPDTTFARDDSVADGGLGFTGGMGAFGNMFDVTTTDTLTSATIFLNSPTTGDPVRFLLYNVGNDIAGVPDSTATDSTGFFVIPGPGWLNISFNCGIVLTPGQYFLAAEQITTNNLACGYDFDGFLPGTTFFGSGTGAWTDIQGIPTLQSALLIRMNFGEVIDRIQASVTADNSLICLGDTVELFASSANATATYSWTGDSLSATDMALVTANPTTSGTYTVVASDAFGCTSTASTTVDVNAPAVSATSTIAWSGINNGTATATGSGGTPPYTYAWNDSLAQTTETAVGLAPGSYTVTITDSIGCTSETTVTVDEAATGLDPLAEGALQLYPNPNNGQFTLQGLKVLGLNNDIHIKVMDSKGSTVFQQRVKGQDKQNVVLPNTLANGLYMIEVRNTESRWTRQMMIQN